MRQSDAEATFLRKKEKLNTQTPFTAAPSETQFVSVMKAILYSPPQDGMVLISYAQVTEQYHLLESFKCMSCRSNLDDFRSYSSTGVTKPPTAYYFVGCHPLNLPPFSYNLGPTHREAYALRIIYKFNIYI